MIHSARVSYLPHLWSPSTGCTAGSFCGTGGRRSWAGTSPGGQTWHICRGTHGSAQGLFWFLTVARGVTGVVSMTSASVRPSRGFHAKHVLSRPHRASATSIPRPRRAPARLPMRSESRVAHARHWGNGSWELDGKVRGARGVHWQKRRGARGNLIEKCMSC